MSSTEVSFDIIEHIGVIAEGQAGWNKEVNLVSWNGLPAKIDIRDWDSTHERMSRGITLTEDAAKKLAQFLSDKYNIY